MPINYMIVPRLWEKRRSPHRTIASVVRTVLENVWTDDLKFEERPLFHADKEDPDVENALDEETAALSAESEKEQPPDVDTHCYMAECYYGREAHRRKQMLLLLSNCMIEKRRNHHKDPSYAQMPEGHSWAPLYSIYKDQWRLCDLANKSLKQSFFFLRNGRHGNEHQRRFDMIISSALQILYFIFCLKFNIGEFVKQKKDLVDTFAIEIAKHCSEKFMKEWHKGQALR